MGIRKNDEHYSDLSRVNSWWQPYNFPLDDKTNFPEQKEYLWDEQRLPEFQDFLQVEDPDTQAQWTVLRGFWIEDQKELLYIPNFSRLECWFRINTIIVCKETLELADEEFKNRRLSEPHLITISSTDNQGFLGEYPWHPVYRQMSGWQDTDNFGESRSPKFFSPVSEYLWEIGGSIGDFSLDNSPIILLTCQRVSGRHGLEKNRKQQWIMGEW